MICRGALVYRLVQCRPARLPVMEVEVMKSAGVMLLVYRVRFSFRRLRLVLLNADPVLHSMTISGARESFVDASHVRLNQRRVRPRKLRRRRLRRGRRRLQILRTLMCRQLRHRQSRRRRRVQLLVLSREVMKGGGALCGHHCLKVRNAEEVSKESRTTRAERTVRAARIVRETRVAQGVRPVGEEMKTDPSHRSNPDQNHHAPSHLALNLVLNPARNHHVPNPLPLVSHDPNPGRRHHAPIDLNA